MTRVKVIERYCINQVWIGEGEPLKNDVTNDETQDTPRTNKTPIKGKKTNSGYKLSTLLDLVRVKVII